MADNHDAASLDKLFSGKNAAPATSEEDLSKDAFYVRIGEVAEEMVARHGKDFAMGVLVLSARFIAEDRPLVKRSAETKLS